MSDPAPDPPIPGDADTAALFARTATEGPAVDAGALLAGLPRPTPAGRFLSLPKSSRRSLVMKLSAVSALAAAVAACVVFTVPQPAAARSAWSRVEDALREESVATFKLSHTRPATIREGRKFEERTFRVERVWLGAAGRSRTVVLEEHGRPNRGRVVVQNPETGRRLKFDPSKGLVRAMPFGSHDHDARWSGARLDWRRELLSLSETPRGELVECPCGTLRKFSGPIGDGSGTASREREFTLWADAATGQPVRVERLMYDGYVQVAEDIQFLPREPALFAASVPAEIVGEFNPEGLPWRVGVDEPAGPDLAGAVLTPGVGFGPIELGMSRDELSRATGVPAFTTGPGEWWFALPARGFTARGTDADGLVQIYAGDGREFSPFNGRFVDPAGGPPLPADTPPRRLSELHGGLSAPFRIRSYDHSGGRQVQTWSDAVDPK